MANISGTLTQKGSFASRPAAGDVLGLGATAAVAESLRYAAGTGANRVDTLYAATLSLSAPQAIDLTSLPGGAGSMARVRELIIIVPDSTAGDDVLAYAAASAGWAFLPPGSHGVPVKAAGGVFRLSDPASTGAGVGLVVGPSSRVVTIAPVASAAAVQVVILGCSAA